MFTPVNGDAPLVGDPFYSSNSIFWTSRETAPGDSVLLTGAFTGATKTIRLAYIPPGTADWQSLVTQSAIVIPTTQQTSTWLSFVVPNNVPPGVYGFELNDPTAPAIFGLANLPSINWVIGVPSNTSVGSALQHQIHDCGAEVGGILRVFGKNFTSANQIVFQSSTGMTYALTPTQIDSNSAFVSLPTGLGPGTYNAWVGSNPWSPTSSAAIKVTIYAPPGFLISYGFCSNMIGDNSTDNTSLLQGCLDGNAPPTSGAKRVVYITIPSGNFVLTGAIKPHPYEILLGSSATATQLIGRPHGAAPEAWFEVPQFFGMANLSLTAPANPYLVVSNESGNPNTSGHLMFSGIDLEGTSDESNGGEDVLSIVGPDIQVYNSTLVSGSNQTLSMGWADGAIISGSQIVLNDATYFAFGDCQNVIFENNKIYSQNVPGQGTNGGSGGAGLAISRGNSLFGPSAVSQDIYVGYNLFTNVGSVNQQLITIDGDGGAYVGPIASSSNTSVTLADYPSWGWMGTTNPQASAIAIISGTGVGQYSLISSYSGETINLLTPWKVPPDATSIVVITQYELNITVAHNTLNNTLGASIVLADSLESVIEDNTLTNSGYGILVAGFGPYGGPAAYGPTMNTDVLRNTIAAGQGNMITADTNAQPNIAGIGMADFAGCLMSGLLIRDNVVSAENTIYQTDGWNLINGVLIEKNQANLAMSGFSLPGLVAQNNTSQ